MEIKYGNILPGKSAYEKIGKGSTHDLNEVVAELIDNSIEAKTEAQKEGNEVLEINVKLDRLHLIVKDNAKGMNSQEAIGSISLFNSTKKSTGLGGFGVGMKSASLSIGNILDIQTGQETSNKETFVRFSIEQWNNDPKLTWDNFPFRVEEKSVNKHGTTITITDLRINVTDLKVSKLRKSIGKRYASYLKSKDIIIKVNEIPCLPEKIDWRDGYPEQFEIETSFGTITGNLGLTKVSSQKGDYGLNMFRNNRLIMQNQKFGISGHPSHAFIVGDINLDFIPVNQDKNKFRTESKEYEIAELACKESDIFKRMIKASGQAGHASGASGRGHETVSRKIPDIMYALASIYNRRGRKDDLPSEPEVLDEVEESNGTKNNGNDKSTKGKKVYPKVYRSFKYILKSGEELKIQHDWVYDETQGRKTSVIDREKMIMKIVSNEGYPPYVMMKDKIFFVCENLADALAELYAQDHNLNISEAYNYKDDLLKDLIKFIYKKAQKEEE